MHSPIDADLPSFHGYVPDRARGLFKANEHDKALLYIKQFVEQGNTYAMLAMADYEYDQGNKDASLIWVSKVESAADSGDHEACIYLASAYQRGLGAGSHEERQHRSLLMLERAAEQGYVSCAHALMSNYLYGLNGAAVSKERFAYWAGRAASCGSRPAAEALGKLDKWPNVAPDSE